METKVKAPVGATVIKFSTFKWNIVCRSIDSRIDKNTIVETRESAWGDTTEEAIKYVKNHLAVIGNVVIDIVRINKVCIQVNPNLVDGKFLFNKKV